MALFKVRHTTSDDIISGLPHMVNADAVSADELACDIVVLAAGFEDRAIAICSMAPDLNPQSVVLVEYPTNEEDNKSNHSRIVDAFCHSAIVNVPYSTSGFRRDLLRALAEVGITGDTRLVVDVSGMASYVLSRVLGVVFDRFEICQMRLFYSEAETYFPTKADYEEFRSKREEAKDLVGMYEYYDGGGFQTRGLEETYESEAFPGLNSNSMPTHVIAVPNFSGERTRAMLAYTEKHYNAGWENRVTWLIGDPPDRDKNGWRLTAVADLFNVANECIPVCTRNYKKMLRVLCDMWQQKYLSEHLVIASLGSKMQHVATILFLMMHRDTGLVLSQPTEFVASRFSSGIGDRWWIDFGSLSHINALLGSYLTIKYTWPSFSDRRNP